MGLIGGLLTLPLAPARGLVWVLEQAVEEAEAQYYDPRRIRAELERAEAALEAGELDEQEYLAIEEALFDRLAGGHD
ncbi:MAG TPA: gas vesicle protein GvpG [Gaiellaceae bacterium]